MEFLLPPSLLQLLEIKKNRLLFLIHVLFAIVFSTLDEDPSRALILDKNFLITTKIEIFRFKEILGKQIKSKVLCPSESHVRGFPWSHLQKKSFQKTQVSETGLKATIKN